MSGIPYRCPLCPWESVPPPPDRSGPDEYVMSAERAVFWVAGVNAHLAGHAAREWAAEVERLRAELNRREDDSVLSDRGASRIVAILVGRLGGSVRVSALDQVLVEDGVLVTADDPGGRTYSVAERAGQLAARPSPA
jgi:hypothetical protein